MCDMNALYLFERKNIYMYKKPFRNMIIFLLGTSLADFPVSLQYVANTIRDNIVTISLTKSISLCIVKMWQTYSRSRNIRVDVYIISTAINAHVYELGEKTTMDIIF